MSISKVIGVDFGNYRIRLSYVVNGKLVSSVSELMPDDVVQDGMIRYWDAAAEILAETLRSHNLNCKNIVISVPMNCVYFRRIRMPLMTIRQLQLNLPYEFHDYINEDMSRYYFDYMVVDRTDKDMELIAAAASRELIGQYQELCRNAKRKLCGLIPETIGIQWLLGRQKTDDAPQKDYAVLDMGERALRIHFFKNGTYEITRSLDPGCRELARIIAEIKGVDIHIAHLMAEAGQDGILSHEKLTDEYQSMAVQIMRVLNFYSFNNSKNTIDTLYCCGGGFGNQALVSEIRDRVTLPVLSVSELLPDVPEEIREAAAGSPQSYGICLL